MNSRAFFRSIALLLFVLFLAAPRPAMADSSHARIIRLSLVQGDVRFTRDAQGDPLADQKATWEIAVLNLPIRQGYVLATDHGRAEVEFENGAMAFLNENTVLEFYDLSLEDGGRTTRLVLRQGTASFYINPGGNDYFSVTGGDFTVEANGRASFRMDNFDDGSNVNVLKGYVNVLRKDNTTPLEKGQSFSMRSGDPASVSIGRLPEDDDFDRWVSGREDSVVTATNAAAQYTSAVSPYYSSGSADLYTYGGWYPFAGYGYCWRPYGVGLGWSPFNYGSWYYDPLFGWSFVGYQPWGWLPYHYGGWLFEPGFGWVWAPGGFNSVFGRPPRWRPVTAVWVHSGATLGIVPSHPMDVKGKAPLNLSRGVLPVRNGAIAEASTVTNATEWKVLKQPPRDSLTGAMSVSTPPTRLSRTLIARNPSSRVVTLSKDSSIAFDAREHRFVNNNAAREEPGVEKTVVNGAVEKAGTSAETVIRVPGVRTVPERAGTATATVTRVPGTPPPSRTITPPPPSRGYSAGSGSAGGSRWSASGRSSAPSAPAPHPSPAPSGRPH